MIKQINQEQALEKRLVGAPITSNWSAICKSESTQSYDYLPHNACPAGPLLSLITDICHSFYDYAHSFKNLQGISSMIYLQLIVYNLDRYVSPRWYQIEQAILAYKLIKIWIPPYLGLSLIKQLHKKRGHQEKCLLLHPSNFNNDIPDICHERHEYIHVNFFWLV